MLPGVKFSHPGYVRIKKTLQKSIELREIIADEKAKKEFLAFLKSKEINGNPSASSPKLPSDESVTKLKNIFFKTGLCLDQNIFYPHSYDNWS